MLAKLCEQALYADLSFIVITLDIFMGGTDQLDEDAGTHRNSYEGKEQGDFVDYGWANIGSFDDFDRIFR